MEFFDAMQKRYSVRSYKDTPVEKEKLDAILKAAQTAPTACNKQAFMVVVFDGKTHGKELAKIYKRPFFTQALYVLGVYANTDETWVRGDGKNYSDVDAAIVMDHMVLAAAALGLGTCWVANFDAAAARAAGGLGSEWEPVVFTPVGYAEGAQVNPERKSLDEIVKYL